MLLRQVCYMFLSFLYFLSGYLKSEAAELSSYFLWILIGIYSLHTELLWNNKVWTWIVFFLFKVLPKC